MWVAASRAHGAKELERWFFALGVRGMELGESHGLGRGITCLTIDVRECIIPIQ